MVINSLKLKDFRNYNTVSVDFCPGINFIHGNNGQGKTNLVESIYVLTHLKSFRTPRIKDLFYKNESSSLIQSSISKQRVKHNVLIHLQGNQKKVILDQKNVNYTSEYIRNFFSILFSPDQLIFFKEYPLERRNFFDRVLILKDKRYFSYLKDFNKIKSSKSVLLKQGKKKEISAWNQILAALIPKIARSREEIVSSINSVLIEAYAKLTGREENLTLKYRNDFENRSNPDESSIFEYLEEKIDTEISKGFLCFGPHKDRFWLTFDQNVEEKSFFSQGEYRISFLALQFAVNQIISDSLGFFPIILLDDIFSELDKNILINTINYIQDQDNQVFITSTVIPSEMKNKGQTFLIEQGRIL